MPQDQHIKYIDLFAGMGGIRIGFNQACKELNLNPICVLSSEVKPHAISIYKKNFNEIPKGDVTKINEKEIPDFDILLGGFPCQAFSSAGKQLGFNDTRGTLFFDILRILKEKKPIGFILENVEGLVNHDKQVDSKPYGKTLDTILTCLIDIGYKVSWKVLNSADFSLPQKRKRIYIVGSRVSKIELNYFKQEKMSCLDSILEKGLDCSNSNFTKKLLKHYKIEDLYGKAVKDKRGGKDNIHCWDIELKGAVNSDQKTILNQLLLQRRKKHWAVEKGIKWMDGMPLTFQEICSFIPFDLHNNLKKNLNDLVKKSYLKIEYPKELITTNGISKRVEDINKEKGYNIVTGKLSFEFNKILDPKGITNTIVATEADRIGVIDGSGIRKLSERECLRLFGYPEEYKTSIPQKELYDLIGNTVTIPVIKAVALLVLRNITDKIESNTKINLETINA